MFTLKTAQKFFQIDENHIRVGSHRSHYQLGYVSIISIKKYEIGMRLGP